MVEEGKASDYIKGLDVKTVSSSKFEKEAVFTLVELEELADIVVTDQYGVKVALNKTKEVATFAGKSTAVATLTLSKVNGDVTFSNNGTTDASVDQFAAGTAFNARVNLSGIAGTPTKVTATKAYSKTGEAAE